MFEAFICCISFNFIFKNLTILLSKKTKSSFTFDAPQLYFYFPHPLLQTQDHLQRVYLPTLQVLHLLVYLLCLRRRTVYQLVHVLLEQLQLKHQPVLCVFGSHFQVRRHVGFFIKYALGLLSQSVNIALNADKGGLEGLESLEEVLFWGSP